MSDARRLTRALELVESARRTLASGQLTSSAARELELAERELRRVRIRLEAPGDGSGGA